MVEKAYIRALEKLCSMPQEQYVDVLADLLLQASTTGTEEVVFSQKDREHAGKAAVEKANKASGKKLTCMILTDAEGNTTGIAYSDHLGNTVDINDVQYLAPAASGGASVPVDINALNIIQKNYFDLDGSGALLE